MKTRRPVSVFGFVLVLVIGLGMTFAAVQASVMTVKMATSGAIGCDLCGGDDDRAGADRCLPACVSPGLGIVPAGAVAYPAHPDTRDEIWNPTPTGIAESPDPSPPKPSVDG